MLDRPRHEDAVKEIREAGARIRFIPHGDVSAALLAVTEGSPVDLLWGIGGTPEGVLSASAIKCMGGQIIGRLWPRNDEERQAALDAGYDLDEVLDTDRLVSGDERASSPPPASPTATCSTACTSTARRARHRVARHALALGHGAHRSPPGTTARSCARSSRDLASGWASRAAPSARRAHERDGSQVEPRQRAQERVGHDHVDLELGDR